MAECIYEDEAQDPADTLTMDRLLPQLPLRLHWFETGYTGSMPPTLILADPSGKRNMLVVYIVRNERSEPSVEGSQFSLSTQAAQPLLKESRPVEF